MTADSKFELPSGIDRYLAALSKLYAQDGDRRLQEIIVNARPRVHEEWSRDNWNGGTYGHALYLVVPESLFLSVAKEKPDIQDRIRNDLNTVHNVQNEFIDQVFLEMEAPSGGDWRKESGVLVSGYRSVSSDAVTRIWEGQGFRLFLTHKSEVKKETADLAERLSIFGMSCFVAHKDIKPTSTWQDEIENALATMDGFVALMTEDFHDSDWTDQEVGFAIARGVPIVAVRMGQIPYGFIGKFQALSCEWGNAAKEIVRLLINDPRMLESYILAVRNCESFDAGNTLSKVLPDIERLDEDQMQRLIEAHNENPEVRESFGFDGTRQHFYGSGLIPHLHRLGSRQYRRAAGGLIEVVS